MKTLLLTAALAALATPAHADTLSDAVAKDMPSLLTLYRDLHANPELSMQEVKTSAKLAAEAKKLGFQVTTGVGKTGVVAVMKNGPGPTLLMRADMDGLPVVEQTGLPFASKVRGTSRAGGETGIMHACGHDTHMTAWVGAARRLAAMKDQWSGTLVMILQPGEETSEGAQAMLADGLYTRFPKPSHVLAFHDSAGLPAGTIGYSNGYALANVDSVDISVKGVGGHGAYPHTTKDPIVLASRIVTALQTLVSRENDPQSPAVVTVGSFHAGAKHNIISDEAQMLLTVRSYSDSTRKLLLDGIQRVVRGEAIAAGMPDDRMPVVTIREKEYTPATFNTATFTTSTAELLTKRFGADRVKATPAVMGGEDFSRFWLADKSIESLIFWVGGVPQAQWQKANGDPAKLPSLHSPFWAPDPEPTISTATEAMVTAALGVLKKG
ncbi:MAG: N-acetyl-L,L-diaminopimelate deacetylase [uncultured Sphingosinicella sp.]|uniref:N-acetyl-L,L-diaminopimelate deacetylase n=1 Tax=uncultured Sphingosinicella sp. TaxID=478748 RepID=A0A6J4TDV2_9SPHN|nr:amidohydrolase [uncultured Sphingosinicella sp.]CAA9520620.1 MAG: N-acetyl-L,L-diaminopimelate deacetylase [uncultured Sphingosinicella sp.]